MNRYISISFFTLICNFSIAQVGIGTNNPLTTLQVKETRNSTNTNLTSTTDGIIIPRLTKAELALKNINTYTPTNNEGILVFITNTSGAITGPSLSQVEFINSTGFYHLASDNKWRRVVKLGNDTTNDAWYNNPLNNRVELNTNSKGVFRVPGTEVVITDNGNLGINKTNPSKRLEVDLSSSTKATDALRITNLKLNSTGNKTLVIDQDGNVGVKSVEFSTGQIQRFPILKIENLSASETKPLLIDSDAQAQSNSINTITNPFIPSTSKTGINLPAGIYRIEIKIVGYFETADILNSVDVRILVDDLVYTSQNYGSNTNVDIANNEKNYNGFTVIDFLELNQNSEINFTIKNSVNKFNVVDYILENNSRIYGSLILIQRLK